MHQTMIQLAVGSVLIMAVILSCIISLYGSDGIFLFLEKGKFIDNSE
jgi:hypothetical protein